MYQQCDTTRPRIHHMTIPKGYSGTLATAGHIVRLIRQGAKDFQVRRTAVAIFRQYGIRPKDYMGEVAALFDWVKRNIRYTRDIYKVELLHSARRMLQLRAGDCDDLTILLAAMLEATGHPVRLVLMGVNPRKPKVFSHIYLEVQVRGRWIALDASMDRPVGWAPKAVVKKCVLLH